MDERYLDLLAEECAEVIQAIMKAKRFGLYDKFEGYNKGRSNENAILREIGDVLAIIDLLIDREKDGIIAEARHSKHLKLKIYGPDGTYIAKQRGNSNVRETEK
ncbi:MAG: MazG nucleotide pyrophosphohydrolase domain-containing protein [Candidatus Anammoxibacter sp.]